MNLILSFHMFVQLWVGMGVFLMATSLRMYAICHQLQVQAQAAAGATAGGLLSHAELRLRMPSSLTLATRARLHGLRLQLALLDREFDDLGDAHFWLWSQQSRRSLPYGCFTLLAFRLSEKQYTPKICSRDCCVSRNKLGCSSYIRCFKSHYLINVIRVNCRLRCFESIRCGQSSWRHSHE